MSNREEFLTDLLITAGDGYADCGLPVRGYDQRFGPERHFLIDDPEVDSPSEDLVEPHTWKVTTKTVERGLERIAKPNPIKHMTDTWKDHLQILNLSDGEHGDYDAIDAMAVVEVGLWGEVVYG